MPIQVAIPKESATFEKRVALTPQLIPSYTNLGCQLYVEKQAGDLAGYSDGVYEGVSFITSKDIPDSDIVLKVGPPQEEEVKQFKPNTILVSFIYPHRSQQLLSLLAQHQITAFAIDLIPRISRAQSMDALTSQATVAGYKAVLVAANLSNRFFPMLTTAAGTVRPCNVTVIGTGVAGLQAIATAKRLGAIVKAYDVRTTTKEQVESLGAKMIDVGIAADSAGGYARELTKEEQQKQQDVLLQHLIASEIIITTAQIPGKQAPTIITKEMLEQLTAGTIIIDVAAESGGNCAVTEPNQIIQQNGITIYGLTNLPSMLAHDASLLYAKNVFNFVKLFVSEGRINFNWDDPILSSSVVTHEGKIMLTDRS